MNVNLPEIETNLELWLGVAADSELNPAQRRQLVRYLDDNPKYWRACAVVFLDEQLLAAEVPSIGKSVASESMPDYASVPKPTTVRESVIGNAGLSKRNSVLLAIAASVVALVFGIGWGNNIGKSYQRELLPELEKNRSQVSVLTDLLIADRSARHSQTLCSLYPDQPMLIEIQNTGDRAVYLTDRPVSEKMLEGFFAAGHNVDVRPYKPRIATSWLQSLQSPVLAIEVDKTRPLMIAQGERP